MRLLLPSFSHIYIESKAFNYEITKRITNRLKYSKIIEISHYKNVFNRPKQDLILQKRSPKLILAVKRDNFYYSLPDICIRTHEHNYYTNSIINCIYDCAYCFLKGMYVSSNIVVYVNIEDYFKELKRLSRDKEIFVALSYESDLLALEGLTGIVKKWLEFLRTNPEITAEIRTKSPVTAPFYVQKPLSNLIISYTLIPDVISKTYEGKVPSLGSRISAIRRLQDLGWRIRLAIDPIFYFDGFEEVYKVFLQNIFSRINSNIHDIHIGAFRIGKDLLKRARKNFQDNPVFFYPFVLKNSYYTYPENLVEYILDFIKKELAKFTSSPVVSTS